MRLTAAFCFRYGDVPYCFHKLLMGEKAEKGGDLVQGTLDMLVLKALSRGPMHGYGVAEWIEQTSEDILRVEEGALYPALHRLELRGLLASEWGVSDNNRRAKFYRLTAAGRRHLAGETEQWNRLTGAIARVMQAT
jgi:transcriptional regulator